jgi:ATP-dependent Lon protease
LLQIYRKAALKLVQDLGEDALPEPTAAAVTAENDSNEQKTVERQDAPSNDPAAPETATPHTENTDKERKVTTVLRKPMEIPDTVHIRITPENLKDYVGPPVYYKDRMYSKAPPPGVSTGLGYLGNGSGAVMPIEATVSSMLPKQLLCAEA